ncbi:MAG: class I SAM-dependent methyltransferase [Deltaproteobacteria bacterium]|nr:class I SAM-dependent methyltransferase [Deltaproteobacteria bacterium]
MSDKPSDPSSQRYIEMLFKSNRLSENAVRRAINTLEIEAGSYGLDAGCGAGLVTTWLAEAVGPRGRVIGIDSSCDMVGFARTFAREGSCSTIIDFREGEISSLPFDDNTFDWLWCKDTFWPASGVADPIAGMRELARVVRPGGKVALLFWSAQGLLPGYPALEARLAVAMSNAIPYLKDIEPERHFLRALGWMRAAQLTDLKAHCFADSVYGPLDEQLQKVMRDIYDMFFRELEAHVSTADWSTLQRLCNPESNDYLARRPDYYFFLNYTLFRGVVN